MKTLSLKNIFYTLILIVISLCTVFMLGCEKSEDSPLKSELTVELGQASVALKDFIKEGYDTEGVDSITDLSSLDLTKLATYDVELSYKGKPIKVKLNVKDTKAPTASAVPVTVAKGSLIEASSLVKDITDATKVTASLKSLPDFDKPGQQTLTVILTDECGNKAEIAVPVTVANDVNAPTISGVKALTTYAGGTVNYLTNVTVTDDYDANPALKVDNKSVDLSKAGTYTVKYTATDASGNTKTVSTTVKVTKYAQSDSDKIKALDALLQKKLDELVNDSMTDREKVKKIYNWAKYNIRYSGDSAKGDYRVEAYNALSKMSGDCYTYFSVTKAMFEKLGISNIDVVKVKNSSTDSGHYWSLVSVDGGKTYYHFDATPRVGDGDNFCLVTDAFLDAYSKAHKNSHNRDKSLYPATPEN